MSSSKNPLIGVLLILGSGLLLASHDGISKQMSLLYPVFLIVWARYFAQFFLMTLIFAPRKGLNMVRTQRPWLQLARGLCLTGVSGLLLTGLRYIPLGEATAVMFLSPLVVTVLSVLLLKERISLGQWGAVLLGLVGVLIIVRPGGALFTPAILLPLGAAICFGVYQLLTRRLNATDNPVTSNYLSSLVGTLLFGATLPFVWETPELIHGLMILSLGALAMVAHLMLSVAYNYASAATLAPFTYGQIVFAALVGLVTFGHVPDLGGLIGMGVIIASGVFSVWVQRRAATA
ncbi:DMT family transporter [Pseudomonas sp.]|uniref:DMT family transporter n=1 Tax=Pseudomonas sp. TaxID=306 RepID=UPI001A09AAA1|nr:DMT family transporter [Pseudomonas sp.]MBF0675316.1 DMT family transporter [Pseudomonas sp.]